MLIILFLRLLIISMSLGFSSERRTVETMSVCFSFLLSTIFENVESNLILHVEEKALTAMSLLHAHFSFILREAATFFLVRGEVQ